MTSSSHQLNRRDLLKAGAVTLAMGALLPAAEKTETGWIDAHSHIWGREVAKFPLANGQTLDDLAPPSFTSEELLATCQPENVQRVVLIQHHIYHGWDNTYLIHEAGRYPDRFRVVGMLDDTQPHPGQKMEPLLKQRVTGFRITSRIRGRDAWLTGDGMAEMWQTASKTGQAMCCLIDPEDLAAVNDMCQRHPDTKVVIDHFSRIGVDGQLRKEQIDQLCGLASHKHVHVKISAYYALGKKQPPYLDLLPMIRRILDSFGTERTMWASDAPYQLGEGNSYAESIALIRDHADFLSAGDKDQVLRGTAAKVYFYV